MRLSAAQIAEFRARGVLIAPDALVDADLQAVIDELSDFIERRAVELQAAGKIEELHADEPFERRYGLLFKQCSEIGKGMDIMHQRGRAIFEFLHNENMLDTVEALVGPDITCNPIQHIRAKPPVAYEEHGGSKFHSVPWHQDAGVMMPEAEQSNVVTCWLPLGDATIEMGCMQVLPGVSQMGYLRHQNEGGTTVVPEQLPDVEPEYLECKRGDVVLMDKFTPHKSTPNLSACCRWSLDLRYQTTGHHTGRTGHPDFVVRSAAAPESVLRDHEEWCRLWIDAFENPRGTVGHRAD